MTTSNTAKKIAVVTGARAEYGLLYWLMREIQQDPDLTLQTIVTCMHLSPEFGYTIKNIEDDGFPITAKVELLLSSDSRVGVAKSVGLGVIGFADAFSQCQPDLVVLLGDRFETLAAAQAAMFLQIPIAHIHGGELSFGAIDEHIRHAITKMSHLHFVAAESYKDRVIQLGEAPHTVFNVGAPGLDHLKRTPLLTQQELAQELNFTFGAINFLVTLHPATANINELVHQANSLLEALNHFPHAHIIFTLSNADASGRLLSQQIKAYAETHADRCKAFVMLGTQKYFSVLQAVDVIIGNSSSGLIEAPLFNKPCVNIGSRQDGRLKAENVIDCAATSDAIYQAIQHALTLKFQQVKSLYGHGDASYKIKDIIKQTDLTTLRQKTFFDLRG